MSTVSSMRKIKQRVSELDWQAIEQSLWEYGYAKTPPLLSSRECEELVQLYPDDTRFRSRIDMARYRFGVGDYKYFAEPLPKTIQELRSGFYAPLASIANRWMEKLGSEERYPSTLNDFLTMCRKRGQSKPTPLLLHYEAGGYNCLHRVNIRHGVSRVSSGVRYTLGIIFHDAK